MIVTCEECSTSFQLDESRIPETGARVRCSRCKHAFFLPSPTASQAQVADSIAEEAAADPLANVPTTSPDLSSSSPGGSLPLAPDSATEVDASNDPEPEEEDWQFSEEIRIEGDDDLDEDENEDLSSSGVFGTALDEEPASDEFSAEDIDSSGLGLSSDFEDPAPATPDARDESDFGSVDDFSSLMEEEDVEPVDLGSDIESEMQIEEAPAPSTSVYASPGTSDDLGDPESWDLVGSDDFAVSRPSAGVVRRSTAEAPAETEDLFDEDSEALPYEEEFGSTSKLKETLSSVGRGVGWAATIVMVGAVLYQSALGEWTRGDQTVQMVSSGGLTAQTTRAGWIETSRAGHVLVFEGELRNDGADSLWPGTLQLAFLDASGGRLTVEPIRAGEPVPTRVLREGSPDQLALTARASALRLRDTPMAPGETRRFEAIALENQLPESASRVLLEMSGPAIVTRLQPAAEPEAGGPGKEPSAL